MKMVALEGGGYTLNTPSPCEVSLNTVALFDPGLVSSSRFRSRMCPPTHTHYLNTKRYPCFPWDRYCGCACCLDWSHLGRLTTVKVSIWQSRQEAMSFVMFSKWYRLLFALCHVLCAVWSSLLCLCKNIPFVVCSLFIRFIHYKCQLFI